MARALVAEDEPHARESLTAELRATDWIDVVAVTGNGREALVLAEREQPDILFLDVRLPEVSGLDVARRFAGSAALVFTTAYDRFAVAAFELGALDYLLKPFGRERLGAALERLRRRVGVVEEPLPSERARAALDDAPIRRLFARSGDRILPIAAEAIRRLEAKGDYVEVQAETGTFLLQLSLTELVGRLDPAHFVRVHRSHAVRWDWVAELRRYDDRRLVVKLKDGQQIVASRAASETLRRLAR
jgi:two-component system LytT family response regulator